MKNRKNLLIGTTTLLVLCLIVFNFYWISNPAESANGSYNFTRTLYWGSSGNDVRTVQDKLSRWGYYKGSVDGKFGNSTSEAVRKFQQKNGLRVDGLVGPATAKALGMTTGGGGGGGTSASTQGVNRQSDEYLLARTIHGEARGEPYVGKVAVAAVVLNRTRNPAFPNTIAGVVYQPLAFTAVADGQINLTPDNESIKAARDALNGWDPTYGCLYYWNPATATSKWIWSRKVTLKIGKHWFGI